MTAIPRRFLHCVAGSVPISRNAALVVVPVADRAAHGVRIAACIKRALSLMEKPVVVLTVTGYEVGIRVVGAVLVNVVNRGAAPQRLHHRAFDDKNVLKDIPVPRRAVVPPFFHADVAIPEDVPTSRPLRVSLSARVVPPKKAHRMASAPLVDNGPLTTAFAKPFFGFHALENTPLSATAP